MLQTSMKNNDQIISYLCFLDCSSVGIIFVEIIIKEASNINHNKAHENQ